MSYQCKDCYYFKPSEGENPSDGRCHYSPPGLIVQGIDPNRNENLVDATDYTFPAVKTGETCGKWLPLEMAPPVRDR